MDAGLCCLLSVKAVPLKEKASSDLPSAGGPWRSKSKSLSGQPVYGKGLRAALVFAEAGAGGSSCSVPPRTRRLRAASVTQANSLQDLLRSGAPTGSQGPLLLPRPPLLPLGGAAQAPKHFPRAAAWELDGQRPPLPRPGDLPTGPSKAATEAGGSNDTVCSRKEAPLHETPKAAIEAVGSNEAPCSREELPLREAKVGEGAPQAFRPPLLPVLTGLKSAQDMADGEASADEDCGGVDGDEASEDGDDSPLKTGIVSAIFVDRDGFVFSEERQGDDEAADENVGDARVEDAAVDEDEAADDDAADSEVSSEASAEEVAETIAGTGLEVGSEAPCDEAVHESKDAPSNAMYSALPAASATPEAAEGEAIVEKPKKKKKQKKKRKKRRKPSKLLIDEEPVLGPKKPAVPRFPHPCLPPALDADSLELIVPISERSPAVVSTKERRPISKRLLLGRFPTRRPLGSLLGEGEQGANDGNVAGGLASLAAAESLGLMLEETPRSQPRRSESHDGYTARSARSSRGKAGDSEAPLDGSKGAPSEQGRDGAAGPSSASLARRERARSEARSPSNNDGMINVFQNSLAIDGQQAKPSGDNKLSVGAKQFLAAKAAEEKKKLQDSVDVSLASLYFSFSSMKDAEGKKVALKNQDKVLRTLHELNTKVAIPITRHFGLRYNFFSEHHCQAKKAGVTVKNPLILRKEQPDGTVTEETRHLVTIRLRLRVHPSKGDPQSQFISRGTQLAVLLHELCHLKHMNHGKDFMLYLRDVFAQATKLGVFDPAEMTNEIPSPWPWENEIFQRGGDVGNEELLALFLEHKAQQRDSAKAAGDETARKAGAEAAMEAVAADVGSVRKDGDALKYMTGVNEAASAKHGDVNGGDAVASAPMPEDGASKAISACEENSLLPAVLAPPSAEIGGAGRLASRTSKNLGGLNLAAAFQKGAEKALHVGCDCCADPIGPTSIAYGEDGDALELETGADFAESGGEHPSSPSAGVKLPHLTSTNLESPSRGQRPSGVPTLPPV